MAGRRKVLAVAGMMAVGVLIGAGLSSTALRRDGMTWPWSKTPAITVPDADSLFAHLPARITEPAVVAQLPDERAVGPAAFLYTTHPDSGPANLVTSSGEVYEASSHTSLTAPFGLGLSPNGRWLGRFGDGRWTLRDLTSTARHELPEGSWPFVWSGDSRYLLLRMVAGDGAGYQVFDLAAGQARDVALTGDAHQQPVALINDHVVAVVDPAPPQGSDADKAAAGRTVTMTWIDLTTGTPNSRLSMDLSQRLGPDENLVVASVAALWVSGGDPPQAWLQISSAPKQANGEGGFLRLVGAIGFDATSGHLLGRVDVSPAEFGDGTVIVGVAGGGLMLTRLNNSNTEIIIASGTGERRTATTLSGNAMVYPPGAHV